LQKTLYDYCAERGASALLRSWHPTRNAPLTAEGVSYGSKKKVWWRCDKGHEWQAAVYARTSAGAGCPYCAGKRVAVGENDLLTRAPELARQWHPTKNAPLTPEMVTPGSSRRVWWRCDRGHQWQAAVKTRADGCGCPVCANRTLISQENDLAATDPELARQWHPTKNGALRPRDVVAGSRKKVWWQCGKGHEWQAVIMSRAKDGAGCPVCAGRQVLPGENDLATAYPHIAAQWHPDQNGTLTPDRVSPFSNRRVWWRCGLGHAWRTSVAQRTAGCSECPYCTGRAVLAGFNDLATVEPQVAAQWHPELNGALTPAMVTRGSNKKVWWRCAAGHVWKAVIYSRTGTRPSGCPVCAGKARPARIGGYAPHAGPSSNRGQSRI